MSDGTSLKVTTPTDTQIVMERAFDAPRHLVFEAWTRPELLKRWLGPPGWNLVECEMDLRVGGSYRFVSHGPDGAEMGHSGVYQEISAPHRLVYTETFDDQWYPGESLVTHVFTARGDHTTVTTTLVFPTTEIRDLVIKSPMEWGVSQGYLRLDDLLSDMAPHPPDDRQRTPVDPTGERS